MAMYTRYCLDQTDLEQPYGAPYCEVSWYILQTLHKIWSEQEFQTKGDSSKTESERVVVLVKDISSPSCNVL